MNEVQPSDPALFLRGVLVLSCGLLGNFLCLSFGVVSWVLGRGDLMAMAEGKMDPSGRDLPRAGRILGITGVILNLLWLVWAIFVPGVGMVSVH